MNNFDILTLKDSKKWHELLRLLPPDRQDIYFSPEYYRLYEELGDGKARCFYFAQDQEIAIYPFLLNSVNELGYDLDNEYFDIQGAYGYNGVVSNSDSVSFRKSFFEAFANYCVENFILAEFTRFHPLIENVRFSIDFMITHKDRNTVFIDLTRTYDLIWQTEYSSKNRNMIRKAQNKQFAIEINENPSSEQIKTFANIYQNTMRVIRAKKYYFFTDEYFTNIFRDLDSHALLFKVVNNENEVECAAIIFIYGIYAHYHLSGRKQKSDNSVNNFLLNEAIKYAQNIGVKKIHLGGGNSAFNTDPLLQFKLNFSNAKGDFYIGKKVHCRNIYEEVIRQWAKKYPEKVNDHNTVLLKYRY